MVSVEWLTWQEHQLRTETSSNLSEEKGQEHDLMAHAYDDYTDQPHPHIQHTRNVGEHHVPHMQYSVDGYDSDTHTAYESYGCYWQGCRTWYPQRPETHAQLLDRSLDYVHALINFKRNFLFSLGYRLVEIWECD